MALLAVRAVFILSLLWTTPAAAAAQNPASGRLLVTVVDPSGAIIPGAIVSLAGIDATTKSVAAPVATTNEKGLATLEKLPPGRYSVRAEFNGFEEGRLPDIRVRNGDNKHVVVLPIKKVEDSVTVGPERQSGASTRANAMFGTTLLPQEIVGLSDDPAEMARQLAELAGPDAIIRVDSFEGQQLPPKSQIKSIHVTRDQFAAESEFPGTTFVDVITQPGVGLLRGAVNFGFRDASMNARNQFTPTKGDERVRRFGGEVGGALLKDKSNFSLSINGQRFYESPSLNVVLPTGGRAESLNLRQQSDSLFVNGLLDYALTKNQTVRMGYSENDFRNDNAGVGAFDLPERAFSNDFSFRSLRLLEAGPIGRRSFINTRLNLQWSGNTSRSELEAPTIVVQDAFTSGGAQRAGGVHSRNFTLASDLDHVRGIHSWRAGVQLVGGWFRSDATSNYLGTFTYSSLAAYDAGQPILYTRAVGDPAIRYFNLQTGVYLQDDIRVRKGLTFSPGLRYSVQTHVDDHGAFEPRFGLTWAPSKSGKTTLRASLGLFHGWLPTFVLEQALRLNGERQREIVVLNPSPSDPSAGGFIPPTNKYAVGDDFNLQKNMRYSAGVEQTFSPRLRMNALYNYFHQLRQPRGRNLNAPVDGVRPNPAFANIIESVTDAQIRRHEVFVNVNASLAPPGPATNRARVNWRRVTVNGGYAYIRARNNSAGAFGVPPSGSLDTEWGPGPADQPYRVNISTTSTQIRNLTANLTWFASDGFPYTLTTGLDGNRDGLVNDRPPGVGLRTLRTARQSSINGRLAYAFTLRNDTTDTGAAGAGRPRLSLFVSVLNLTNRANLGGYSGVMTSPFFQRPTTAVNPRKVDMGVTISF